jgi:hypothetical protein
LNVAHGRNVSEAVTLFLSSLRSQAENRPVGTPHPLKLPPEQRAA